MSVPNGTDRVLRPRPSRSNLNGTASSDGSVDPGTASMSSSTSRVEDSSRPTSIDGRVKTTTTTTTSVTTSAEDVKARLAAARNVAIDRIHDPAPSVEAYHRLAIAWLFLTVLLGTLISLITSGSAVTAFRGRLPVPSNRITLSSTHLPGPLSAVSLDYLLPSYFANKRNVFNVIFVKKAWGWTTLAWGAHWLAGIYNAMQVTKGSLGRKEMRKYVYRPVKRWGLATIWWLLFTTWAFGPGLSDRILVYSGAQCMESSLSSDALQDQAQTSNPNLAILDHSHCIAPSWQKDVRRTAETAAAAQGEVGFDQHVQAHSHSHSHTHADAKDVNRKKRAYWVGGHDLSGHAFLLSMSTLFLLSEVAPTLSATYLSSTSGPSTARRIELASRHRRYAALGAVTLVSLWFWMLLMTSLYFHTPQEKFTGLLAGVVGWYVSFVGAG